MTSSSPPEPPTRVAWGLVVLLGSLTAFGPMSIDMYLPALPDLTRDLSAAPERAQLTLATFFAGMAIGQFFYGPASDRFGRRIALLIGIGIYIAASAACAVADSIDHLILARLMQALGACAGGVVARASVRDRFSHVDTARVLSLLTLIMGLAPILAPLLGGWMLSVASWRAIFWTQAVFGVLCGLGVILRLQESRSEETAAQARAENPFRAFQALLRNPRLIGYAMAGAMNGAVLFTYISASPQLVIGAYGFSPQAFGWVFGANAIGVIGASQVNRFLLRRLAPDTVLARASIAAVISAVLMTFFAWTGIGGMWSVMATLFAALASYGLMGGNTMAGALSVDPRRAGSVSALMGGASFGAGALAAWAGGALHDGTARPMAGVMLLCLVGSMAALYLLAFRRPQSA